MKIITIEKSRLDAFKASRRDHGINPNLADKLNAVARYLLPARGQR